MVGYTFHLWPNSQHLSSIYPLLAWCHNTYNSFVDTHHPHDRSDNVTTLRRSGLLHRFDAPTPSLLHKLIAYPLGCSPSLLIAMSRWSHFRDWQFGHFTGRTTLDHQAYKHFLHRCFATYPVYYYWWCYVKRSVSNKEAPSITLCNYSSHGTTFQLLPSNNNPSLYGW